VLVLGILEGILLAALISVLLLLALSARPHVAVLGRIPGTEQYSDIERHPQNEPLVGVLGVRPEASLLYLNADYVLSFILAQVETAAANGVRTVVCDLSASPTMDLAGARMLAELCDNLANRDMRLTVANAHGRVRDLLRAEGLDGKIRGIARGTSLEGELSAMSDAGTREFPRQAGP
jgi:MFS superfamily sulfate permease-like transporter